MRDEDKLNYSYEREVMMTAQDLLASMLNDLGDDELTINSSQPCGNYELTFKRK